MELIAIHSRRLWLCYKIIRSIYFNKGTQTFDFDFIKRNVVQKLAYKVKYSSQINGGLIMFFRNSKL